MDVVYGILATRIHDLVGNNDTYFKCYRILTSWNKCCSHKWFTPVTFTRHLMSSMDHTYTSTSILQIHSEKEHSYIDYYEHKTSPKEIFEWNCLRTLHIHSKTCWCSFLWFSVKLKFIHNTSTSSYDIQLGRVTKRKKLIILHAL
jgi:hypothetical protein